MPAFGSPSGSPYSMPHASSGTTGFGPKRIAATTASSGSSSSSSPLEGWRVFWMSSPPTIVGPVAEVASIAIVGIVIWDFMADDGKKAAILHAISIECGEFELRLRSLWMSLNSGEDVDESAIRQELYAIEDGLLRVTARPGHADIAEHDRDNKRAAEDAYQVISDRFAPEGGGDD